MPARDPERAGADGGAVNSSANHQEGAHAVLGLVDDFLYPQAVGAIGKFAYDRVSGRRAEQLCACLLEHGDPTCGGIGILGVDDAYHAALRGLCIADLRIHSDDVRRYGAHGSSNDRLAKSATVRVTEP